MLGMKFFFLLSFLAISEEFVGVGGSLERKDNQLLDMLVLTSGSLGFHGTSPLTSLGLCKFVGHQKEALLFGKPDKCKIPLFLV